VRCVRGRREWLVVAAGLLAVGISALPAMAQTADPTTTTSAPPESSTTTTETGITLLPTTTSTDLVTSTTVRRTTTTVRRTTTTLASGPVVTLPATTTTTELLEPNAPVLPTTTSLPPPRKFDKGVSAGSLVLLVITALMLIALVLSVFTYKFWRSTRPVPPALGSTVPKHG